MLTLRMPSAMKEIGNSLTLTQLRDTNGNSLRFVPCTANNDTDPEDLEVTVSNMSKEEEYNLEDNFDRLEIIERDGDGPMLEELGPGVKRTFSTQSQNAADETDEQSAKRRLQASRRPEPRPPPDNSRQTRIRSDSTVLYPQPAINRGNATQPSPGSTSAGFSQGDSLPGTSAGNVNCERPVPVSGSDLSAEVEDDGAPAYSEEDHRKIYAIKQDLLNSAPMCPLGGFGGMEKVQDNPFPMYRIEVERQRGAQVSGPPAMIRSSSTTTAGGTANPVGPPVPGAVIGEGDFLFTGEGYLSDSVGPFSNVSSRSGQMPTAPYAVGPPQTNLSRLEASGPPAVRAYQSGQPSKPGPMAQDVPSTSRQQQPVHGTVTGPPAAATLSMAPRGPPSDLSPLSLHSRDSGLSGSNSSISSNGSEKNANSASSSSSGQQEAQKRHISVSSESQAPCSSFSPGVSSPPGYPMLRSNSTCSNSSICESRDSGSCMQEASPTGSLAQLSPKVSSPGACPAAYQFPLTPESDRQSSSSVCQSPDWPRNGFASPRTPAQNRGPVVHGVIVSSALHSGGHCSSVQQQVAQSPVQVKSPADYGLVSPSGVDRCVPPTPQMTGSPGGQFQSSPRNPPFSPHLSHQVRRSPPAQEEGLSPASLHSPPSNHNLTPSSQCQSPSAQDTTSASPGGQVTLSPEQNGSPLSAASGSGQTTFSPPQNRSPGGTYHAQSPPHHRHNFPQTSQRNSSPNHQFVPVASVTYPPARPPVQNQMVPGNSSQSLNSLQSLREVSQKPSDSQGILQSLQALLGNSNPQSPAVLQALQSLLPANSSDRHIALQKLHSALSSHTQTDLQNCRGSAGTQPSSLPVQNSHLSHHNPQQNSLYRQSSLPNHRPATSQTAGTLLEIGDDEGGDASDPEVVSSSQGSGSGSSPGSPDCCSPSSPSPEDILNAACDERGEWVKDEYGDTFLHFASTWTVDEDTVCRCLYLAKDKPNFSRAINEFNKNGEVPLFNAVCYRKNKLVQAFLNLGADVNRLCNHMNPRTCLHQAVEQGDPRMVATLLSCPYINVDARRSSDGCTPLMVAMMKHIPGHPREDCLEIIRLMVGREDKPDFTIKDTRSSKTMMMFAVGTKDVRVLDLILEEIGVDEARQLINMTSRAGDSAVHMAAGLRNEAIKEQMLSKMIRAGGETTKKNHEGFTPKDWARNVIERVAVLK